MIKKASSLPSQRETKQLFRVKRGPNAVKLTASSANTGFSLLNK